jgi:hypothetical protein
VALGASGRSCAVPNPPSTRSNIKELRYGLIILGEFIVLFDASVIRGNGAAPKCCGTSNCQTASTSAAFNSTLMDLEIISTDKISLIPCLSRLTKPVIPARGPLLIRTRSPSAAKGCGKALTPFETAVSRCLISSSVIAAGLRPKLTNLETPEVCNTGRGRFMSMRTNKYPGNRGRLPLCWPFFQRLSDLYNGRNVSMSLPRSCSETNFSCRDRVFTTNHSSLVD